MSRFSQHRKAKKPSTPETPKKLEDSSIQEAEKPSKSQSPAAQEQGKTLKPQPPVEQKQGKTLKSESKPITPEEKKVATYSYNDFLQSDKYKQLIVSVQNYLTDIVKNNAQSEFIYQKSMIFFNENLAPNQIARIAKITGLPLDEIIHYSTTNKDTTILPKLIQQAIKDNQALLQFKQQSQESFKDYQHTFLDTAKFLSSLAPEDKKELACSSFGKHIKAVLTGSLKEDVRDTLKYSDTKFYLESFTSSFPSLNNDTLQDFMYTLSETDHEMLLDIAQSILLGSGSSLFPMQNIDCA